ncbi:ClpB protein [Ruminococcaceae bacterium BL-4]|nr:ClpB protein [Ruminococcaceae bacterium BL-4]
MIDHIVIFYGSKKDFESYLSSNIDEEDKTISFMEMIQHYNARLRPNESGVPESALFDKLQVDNCIVRADDYGSVLEHVLSNFVNIVSLNYDIEQMYIQNPPKQVLQSLCSVYSSQIEYEYSKYRKITRSSLKQVYRNLNKDILGQDECKIQIISGLYRLSTDTKDKPAVLMLYGPSGVGKTETAKSISKTLGGELLRVQFSMMQSNEAYNYVFGAEHSKSSFARDMMARESNVILIDEFDKVNPIFYNAFYELFDEGKFVDTNYEVNLKNAIFLCTSNFLNEEEIKKSLGPAMFSRIGCYIEYKDISAEQKRKIVDNWYSKILEQLNQEEKNHIEQTNILVWFKENTGRYDNIRILKTKLENAIFDELTDTFIINEKNDLASKNNE